MDRQCHSALLHRCEYHCRCHLLDIGIVSTVSRVLDLVYATAYKYATTTLEPVAPRSDTDQLSVAVAVAVAVWCMHCV
jgi:hypothetical protein